ncbi:MAG: hypothetical protein A2V83_03830 [Nitrospirae bacterium RBG_16_64_22]|nr:MAG: hypothetical protein A2V83_03830 [Nitrospirae bacterium RBG_16_64_22]
MESVAEIQRLITRIDLESLFALLIGFGLAILLDRVFFGLSLLLGGAAGLVNFHWLARAVDYYASLTGARVRGMTPLYYMAKLSSVFFLFFAAAKWQIADIGGVAAGFTIVLVVILVEGYTFLRRHDEESR